MKRSLWPKLIAILGSASFALLVFEVGARIAMEESDLSHGRLAGFELPPLELVGPGSIGSALDAPVHDVLDGGQPVTRGDLEGLIREDPVLGHAPQESAVSERGWWQSNDVGARARVDTPRTRPAGRNRVLVFGESFTNGSRVPQEESWPHFLDQTTRDWEVVNLAVDGYGMGQALLRYQLLRERLDHDAVMLGFVPRADLVRDINTLRSLLGWRAGIVVPRFVIEAGELVLVPSPFESVDELRLEAAKASPNRLISHLQRYDSFYFEDAFELPPVIGNLLSFKLLKTRQLRARQARLYADSMRPGSEALQVTRAIIDSMAREVISAGSRFVLVYIPLLGDLLPTARVEWDHVASHCPAGAICVDLLDRLAAAAPLDSGRDGTHYGPRTNALIASIVRDRLLELR